MSRYTGKVKVVCTDLLCFPADPVTLDAVGTCVYDAYAWTDPEAGPVETIDVGEWNRRRNALRATHQRAAGNADPA